MTLNPEKQFNSTFTALRIAIWWAVLFAVFSFVYADDYSSDMWSMVEEDLSSFNSTNTLSDVQSVYLQSLRDRGQSVNLSIAKFVRFECSTSRGGSINNIVYFFSQFESAMYSMPSAMNGNLSQYYLGAYNYSESAGVSLDNVDSDKRFYILQIRNSNSVCFMNHRTQGTVSKSPLTFINTGYESDLNSFYMRNIYNTYDTFYGGDIDAYGDLTSNTIIARGDNYLVDDDCKIAFYTGQSIEWVDDSRMQFSTFQSQLGNDILHIELSQFINNGFNISNTTLNELSFVIEYTNKTTGNISEMTYTYDNDSEYFHEYGSNSFIERIYLNIPYYEFSGYDLAKNSFPDYSDVRITSAILDLDYYVPGAAGSTNIKEFITTNYYLQHEYTEIVPNDVTNPNYENTVIYDSTVINNMKTALHNKTSQYSFISGDWIFVDENSLPTFESWATVFTNYVWFADANSDSTYNGLWWQMANNLPSTADLTRPFDPSEFIELNKTWSFYDVVLLKVWRVTVNNVATVPVLQSYDLAGYLVLISDRYYQHYEVENQLGIIEILQNDATNSVAFYESIRERVDDFEKQTLKAISGENNSIFSYINDLDSDLNTGISRIVDSIPDTFDDTSILDKLEDILDALTDSVEENEIDTPQECVQFYLDHSNDDLEDINITLRPAFFEGATLDFLYNLVSEGEEENTLRSSMRDGSSSSSFNILWKLYNIIRSVYRDSDAGETITFVLDDMGDSNSYYNALFRSDFDPNNWGYLYE